MNQCKHCMHTEDQHDPVSKVCLVNEPDRCYCMTFDAMTPKIIREIEQYVTKYIDTEERVKAVLEKIPNARNIPNKGFVFLYWQIFSNYVVPPKIRKELTDPETIRRCKQKVVEDAPEKFGPYDADMVDAKGIKELATAEWAIFY